MNTEDIRRHIKELKQYFNEDFFIRFGIVSNLEIWNDPKKQIEKTNVFINTNKDKVSTLLHNFNIGDNLLKNLLVAGFIISQTKEKVFLNEFSPHYKHLGKELKPFFEAMDEFKKLPFIDGTFIKEVSIKTKTGANLKFTNNLSLLLFEFAIRDLEKRFRDMRYNEVTVVSNDLHKQKHPTIERFLQKEYVKGLLLFLKDHTNLIKKEKGIFVGQFLKIIGHPLLKSDDKEVLGDYSKYIYKTLLKGETKKL